ncbi:glycoside hydrolase family protein [Algoriphagus pacificus]|uniref:Glycoside hydrolase family protein n=1 Tax=Algoriphagus pacificus TaxID=2811234 RepID=A0ABS3CFK5_9BACT|nr:glycoside hydrolase family protein [Algoriphagus pacificus]MBN7815887.1 glycoside hydrolase family protein [Algoriphagus pacificus]
MRKSVAFLSTFMIFSQVSFAQIEERARPAEWKNLVEGGKFIDLFQPIPPIGKLTADTWGTATVKPRYVDNGIEDNEWSYWGGNILKGEDGQFHMFVCRWREDSSKGHHEWPNSIVVHAVADNSMGPFKVVEEIGKGHNPEIYQTADGRYVIYVIDGYYVSESINGPWEYSKFEFDSRDRPIIEGLSNLTFARREDGSYLMVCRGGGVWFSKDGVSTFNQVSDERVYPPVDGRFEDPVIWKDNVQYHLIVNDWLGRIAFYQRSKDGVHWKTDPGEAYMPGITIYEDGTNEDWFKYERIKIFQDELGRAVQANFAVIDTLKNEDKPNDRHSSKNIGIPLKVGMQLELLNKKPITASTKFIKVLVKAEQGFNPQEDLDLASLRFGASEEVNFGRGAKVLGSQAKGYDLEITFEGKGNGFREDNFAGKMIGKDKNGAMVFGYSRLPWVDYNPAILSARKPEINMEKGIVRVKVENFGQIKSKKAKVSIEVFEGGKSAFTSVSKVQKLDPFEGNWIELSYDQFIPLGSDLTYKLTIHPIEGELEETEGELKDSVN